MAAATELTRHSLNSSAEQVPFAGHAFEHVRPARLKGKPRASHEIPHCLRDQDFARRSKRGHTSTDMHRDSREIGARNLAFA